MAINTTIAGALQPPRQHLLSPKLPKRFPRQKLCSFFFWGKFFQQVRPVTSDNAAYFVIDGSYDLKAFLELPANQFEFSWTEGATVQEFHWHVSPTIELEPRSRVGTL
jgi:hypothetical protein